MAKVMLSVRVDAALKDGLAERAAREGRSVSNLLELLLRNWIRSREALERLPQGPFVQDFAESASTAALTERGHTAEPERVKPVASSPRSVSPADVAATIPDVTILRPHFRKDRPALQCDARIAPGQTCTVCGAVVS